MGPAAIRFSLPVAARAGSEARIDIYNASGRLVKTIPAGPGESQAGELTWNRRLDSGAEAPAGIYFLKLSQGTEAASAKFVLLR
jgi:flagellar hook assembly protein FlgD